MPKIYSRSKIRIPNIFANVKNKRKLAMILIFITAIVISAKVMLDAVNPIFDTLCENEAKSLATIISNEQATNVMREHSYDELFTVEKDTNGNVTMIKSNVIPINEIISDVAIKIQEEINKQGRQDIEIALGSFTGIKLLAGRGPGIKIRISTVGNVETDLKSELILEVLHDQMSEIAKNQRKILKILEDNGMITSEKENK